MSKQPKTKINSFPEKKKKSRDLCNMFDSVFVNYSAENVRSTMSKDKNIESGGDFIIKKPAIYD